MPDSQMDIGTEQMSPSESMNGDEEDEDVEYEDEEEDVPELPSVILVTEIRFCTVCQVE
jgi:hypothetical protein